MFFRRFRRGCSVLFPGAMERAQTWADNLLSYHDEYLLVNSENFTGEETTRAN